MPPHHMIGDENGKYRLTGTKAHGSPAGQPGGSSGGTDPAATGNEAGIACPFAGIRAGEIIAYRAWGIIQEGEYKGLLGSMVVPYVWLPKAINKSGGIPNAALARTKDYSSTWCSDTLEDDGFYAFKNIDKAASEYSPGPCVVLGRVALWGNVIEFTEGYRAEYAKVLCIDRMSNARWQRWRLNKKYGCENLGG